MVVVGIDVGVFDRVKSKVICCCELYTTGVGAGSDGVRSKAPLLLMSYEYLLNALAVWHHDTYFLIR